jgi:hypothetical protein
MGKRAKTEKGLITNSDMNRMFERSMLKLKSKGIPAETRTYLCLQEAPKISRQSAHEVGKVLSPRHRLPLLPGDTPCIHFS